MKSEHCWTTADGLGQVLGKKGHTREAPTLRWNEVHRKRRSWLCLVFVWLYDKGVEM